MKQFHRILLEKELVFFLKKTTNFCTATMFDIHLIKKETKSTEEHNTVHMWLPIQVWTTENGIPSKEWVSPCSISEPGWQSINWRNNGEKAGKQIPYHYLILMQYVIIKKNKAFCILTNPQKSPWAKDLLICLPLKS